MRSIDLAFAILTLLISTVTLADPPPSFYQKRVEQFNAIIKAKTTRAEKITTALKLARDPNSVYRKDAVRFLVEVKAVETVPELAKIGRASEEMRDEVVVAMNSFQTKEAIDYLIECLLDDSPGDNVRTLAIRGLRDITRQIFAYNPSESQAEHERDHKVWKAWWDKERANFKRLQVSDEDRQEADKAWEKYGVPYLSK